MASFPPTALLTHLVPDTEKPSQWVTDSTAYSVLLLHAEAPVVTVAFVMGTPSIFIPTALGRQGRAVIHGVQTGNRDSEKPRVHPRRNATAI